MQKEYAKKLRFLYGCVLAVLTLAVAVLFIVEAADIYYSGAAAGGEIYSRAIIGKRLRVVLIPVMVWLVAVIGGYVLSVLYPYAEKSAHKADARTTFNRLRKRMPQAEGEEFLAEKKRFSRYERTRLIIWSCVAAFVLAAAIVSIVYLADTSHFAAFDVSKEILGLVKNVMPWVGASFLLIIGATVFDHFSAKKELASMKKLLVIGRGAPLAQPCAFAEKRATAEAVLASEKVKLAVRVGLVMIGLVLLILGIVNGGAQDVLFKAINICKECIGIG